MIAWVFDVDGVLCDTGKTMPEDFRQWFLEWAQDKSIFIVTGSERERTISQIGEDILKLSKASFHCLGNSIWVKNEEFRINQFNLTTEEHNWLMKRVLNSPFPIKTGQHFVMRPGSVNFSIVGKNADESTRQEYNNWDLIYKERESLIRDLQSEFPRLEAFIGGKISIDICKRSANKSQAEIFIRNYRGIEQIYFFADKLEEYGVDKPFADLLRPTDKLFPINGFLDTWQILKTL